MHEDYLVLAYDDDLTTSGDPAIGSWSVTPSSLIRGTKVTAVAGNVVDDGHVGTLRVYLDANHNSVLDDGDRFVDYASKSGNTFSVRLDTDEEGFVYLAGLAGSVNFPVTAFERSAGFRSVDRSYSGRHNLGLRSAGRELGGRCVYQPLSACAVGHRSGNSREVRGESKPARPTFGRRPAHRVGQ